MAWPRPARFPRPSPRGAPHRVAGRAPAEAAVGQADAAVQAQAVLQAAGPVRVSRAALVAVQARPAWPAGALAVHRVAAAGSGCTSAWALGSGGGDGPHSAARPRGPPEAVLRVAGAGRLAAEAVEAVGAEALSAAVPGEAVFTQTRAIGGETARTRGAVARPVTVLPEAAHRALVAAPGTVPNESGRAHLLPVLPANLLRDPAPLTDHPCSPGYSGTAL